jgi:outer membrane protein
VKQTILLGAVAAILAGSAFSRPALAQGTESALDIPHKVGLIDMAYVFNEYEKFRAMKEELQASIAESEAQAQAMLEQLQLLEQQISSNTLAQNSPELSRLETDFLQQQAALQAFQRSKQVDFMRREAEMYKNVYLDVEHAVGMFADYHHYTLIMRFNRAEVTTAGNPQEIIQSLNRQVVYYRQGDDITDQILGYLNSQFREQTGSAAPAQPSPQGNSPRPPQ